MKFRPNDQCIWEYICESPSPATIEGVESSETSVASSLTVTSHCENTWGVDYVAAEAFAGNVVCFTYNAYTLAELPTNSCQEQLRALNHFVIGVPMDCADNPSLTIDFLASLVVSASINCDLTVGIDQRTRLLGYKCDGDMPDLGETLAYTLCLDGVTATDIGYAGARGGRYWLNDQPLFVPDVCSAL